MLGAYGQDGLCANQTDVAQLSHHQARPIYIYVGIHLRITPLNDLFDLLG